MKTRFPVILLSIALFGLGHALVAQDGPELSADEPINFSAETGMLIAAGNAVFTDQNTRVEADQIRYQRDRGYIEAEGNVRVTRTGIRLIADKVTYDTRSRSFSATDFRAGYPPVFISGEGFEGTLDELEMRMIEVSFREPVEGSPRLRAQRGNYVANELLQAQEVSLQAFPWLSVPLPDLRATGAERIVQFESNAGYSDELGAFAHALALVPVGAQFALGGRLGLYSERGVLVGPAAAFDSGDGIKAAFSSGWIRDHNQSRRGLDVIGSPIDRDRGFIEWSLHSRSNDDRLQVNSAGWVVSDSEVLRDFVDNAYERNFQPDAFAAFTWQNGPWVVDLLARAQLNDYYGMVERLPELRIEYLPTPIADSGLWVQAFMVATRYRQQALDPLLYALQPLPPALGLPSLPAGSASLPSELVATDTFSRVETGFTVLRPFHFAGGIDLTLRAGGRWSSFHHSATTTRDLRSEARTVGELGADLQQTLARDFRWQDRRGRAIRMRHISRTFAQYRWHPGAEDQPSIVPAFDILPYSPMAPVINLADIQHSDGIRDWSLLRFGWEHRFQRSVDGAPARDWLLLSATQDLRFDSDPGEADWDGLYLAADFRPYPWLRLQYAQKLNADSGNTESTLVRAAINSSDIWAVGLTAEYLRARIEQYEADAAYRISQNWTLLARVRYDAAIEKFTRQQYGIAWTIGNAWQIETYISINENDARDDDFSVGLRLNLLDF